MQPERVVIREKTLKYWLVGGTVIAPGADRFWKMRGFTRRRRSFVYLSLAILLIAIPLILILRPPVDLALFRGSSKLPAVFWMLAPGVAVYLALRVLFLPMYLYGAHLASRVRKAEGRLCWECGKQVGPEREGVCGCGEHWNAEALRQFWTACALLPATQRELRAARFVVGGEQGDGKAARGFRLLWFLLPLPRDQMSAWQERPLTQKWIKNAMRLSAGLMMVVFLGIVFAMLILARTLSNGTLSTFVGGIVAIGLISGIAQIAIMRWSFARAVRRARKRVREADGLICTDCGFALTGLDECLRCPECGIEFRADELRGFFRASGILEAAAPTPSAE